ncbi:MBL fold metallo-hydrolase [Acinetobacter calcoaceticus]|uniref:Beta-lactamase n=1 Tax=Acinetobacter oleivorans TaxID=1148157 RepID=A0A0B2UA66_9GAMM|nr:MBL fold metallo-hydrolase [Acinetobacter calcoaceticus]KHN65830.1 beta-lactamase [Acinetobacter oleivorans]KUM11999.1 MBL fold metallo-hydrolase [Acinetobacter calcoaceticus]
MKSLKSIAILLLASASVITHAQQNFSVHQVDGYFLQPVGNLKVTALFDGKLGLPRSDLLGIPAEKANQLFTENFVPIDEHNHIVTDFSAYLVQTPTQNILIDAGTAKCFGPTLGYVRENLKKAGVQPEQIDTILITHAHPDHLCGITLDGKMAYPNAKVYLAKEDVDYWTSTVNEAKATDFFKPIFKMTRDALKPYQKAGQLIAFTKASFNVPNVQLITTHGHTKGHSSYLVDGQKGQKFLGLGDVVHYAAVQFPYPEASYKPDTDSKHAIAVRKSIFEQAYKNQWWVGAAHVVFPGIGHIGKNSKGYQWVPAQYRPVK